jgi:hypothetical protein
VSDLVRLFGPRSSRRAVLVVVVAVSCLLGALMIGAPSLASHYWG